MRTGYPLPFCLTLHKHAWRHLLLLSVFLVASGPALAADSSQIPARIETLLASGKLQEMHRPDFHLYAAALREFYAPAAYAPAWFVGTALSPEAASMIQLFRDARQKGLDPEDYDASRWDDRLQALRTSNADIAVADVALTVCTMRYVSDIRHGRINPKHLQFDLPVEQKKDNLAQFLRQQLLGAADVPTLIASIEPPFAGYRRTEEALAHYVELARADDGEKLPLPAKPVEPGQPYAGVARLERFLRLIGDLPADTAVAPTAELYAGALVDGVKRFQRRHGLDVDGRIGPATVRELNVPLADRVHQLGLALERWRWLPSEFVAPPIIVNIPDFRLRTLDASNATVMDMRVVVGAAMRTETPVFSRDMTYVVFRPYWVVPPGIMRRQIIPGIQKDRDYIAKNRYEVTTHKGEVIASGTISDDILAQLRTGKLMVRQKPGPGNALGLIKLMFPNEHYVYLHSTPATELFSRARRDFSSGCIRVEKPDELTVWVLRHNPGWTLERVRHAMLSGRDDVTVRLAQRVPVFIVYGTAIAYENGETHFYDDLYGHDRRLTEALSPMRGE